MKTFTVYCHGTGFNSQKGREKDELVAWCHDNTQGVEATLASSKVTGGSYMINEGPGHGGVGDIALPQQVNPITGDSKQNRALHKRINPFNQPSMKEHLHGKTGGKKSFANIKGNLDGQGWDENVIRTVNIIQDLQFEKRQGIQRVNLVGWSRGAVTCIRIAHMMHEVFSTSIMCNIFAVDPVAGKSAGIKMADTRMLKENVSNYVAVLAMHEMRSTFKPQDWSRLTSSPSTTAVMLPMPGVHNAQVIAGNPADSAYVTRSLAYGFLTSLGTQLDTTPDPPITSAAEMCEAYARLVLSLSEHKSYQTKGLGDRAAGAGSFRRRIFATHSKMDTYTKGGKGSYWINEHHRACFRRAFPSAYEFIFERKPSKDIKMLSKVDFTLFRTIGGAVKPDLANSLLAKELMDIDQTYMLMAGAGFYSGTPKTEWPSQLPLHA